MWGPLPKAWTKKDKKTTPINLLLVLSIIAHRASAPIHESLLVGSVIDSFVLLPHSARLPITSIHYENRTGISHSFM